MKKGIMFAGLIECKPIKGIRESYTSAKVNHSGEISIKTGYLGSLYLILSKQGYETDMLDLVISSHSLPGGIIRDEVSLSRNLGLNEGIPIKTALEIYSRVKSPEEFYRIIEKKERFPEVVEGRIRLEEIIS